MRLCNTDPQINCFTFSHLYVVVQLVWIAAFLVSTKFEHFRCQPPGKISYGTSSQLPKDLGRVPAAFACSGKAAAYVGL